MGGQALKEMISSLILPFADFMFAVTNAIPLGVVRAAVFAIIAVLAFWVIRMPAQLPENEEKQGLHLLKDLRFFALGVLVLQALLYIVF
ncbi:hypothetical protein ACFL47_06060 [Candidatus Latescibacterota bacterium]